MPGHQGNESVQLTAVTERDGQVRFETGKGGTFAGTLNRDGATLAGTWRQRQFTRWVVFTRRAAAGAVRND